VIFLAFTAQSRLAELYLGKKDNTITIGNPDVYCLFILKKQEKAP
jgi:hypothetical protein